ncbi:MAG: 7TM domain-containing protein [Candidatus Peribacteraceae bacterium]
MKPWSVRLAASILFLGFLPLGGEAAGGLLAQVSLGPPRTQAVISAPEDVPARRPILLDASQSRIVGLNPQYVWFVRGMDEPISRTVDAIYTPDRPGTYLFRLVVQTTVDGNLQQDQTVHEVKVYQRKVVLITDQSVDPARVEAQIAAVSGSLLPGSGLAAGLYVKTLSAPFPASSADRFMQYLGEHIGTLQGADAIILWTKDPAGSLPALQQALRRANRSLLVRGRSIVLVTGGSLKTLAETARAPFVVLQPDRVVLLHPDALGALLQSPDVPSFLEGAGQRDIDVEVVDASTHPVPPWRPLSLLVHTMLVRGIAGQTVLLLLMLPVIATILSFLKQVIGVVTYGLFVPSIIALSFLALGWWVGVLFLLFIVLAGSVSRFLVRRLHILFIPKMAIIITLVSMLVLVLLAINVAFGIVASRDTVFVLLIMSTLSESFLSAKAEQGWASASTGIAQTGGAALLCVFIVQWSWFQTLILAYPELLLLTILANFLVGRYTGLRLSEYVRFRAVLQQRAEE